jgi:uncharacterized membrane protein YeiH
MPQFHIPVELDYLAIFAWALSGAILGLKRRLDLIGVLVIATVSSVGGGLLRDGLMLQRTPPVLTETFYLPLIAAASMLAIIFKEWIRTSTTVDRVVSAIDALATPAFAVIGMELALRANIHMPGVLLVGCISGMGGGLIRDIMTGEVPEVMKPGHYLVIPLICACAFFLAFTRLLGADATPIAWITVAAFFVFRLLTLRFDWQTRPLIGDDPGAPKRK